LEDPTDQVGQEAAVIREAIRAKGMVALGRVVLARREHVVMLEAFEKGLLAIILRDPYEVSDQAPYFEDIRSSPLILSAAKHRILILDICRPLRDRTGWIASG
jgi:non-homologous end joining protein Ku